MYLSKFQNVFVFTERNHSLPETQSWCMCPNCQIYLSKLQNMFVLTEIKASPSCNTILMYLSSLSNIFVQIVKRICYHGDKFNPSMQQHPDVLHLNCISQIFQKKILIFRLWCWLCLRRGKHPLHSQSHHPCIFGPKILATKVKCSLTKGFCDKSVEILTAKFLTGNPK